MVAIKDFTPRVYQETILATAAAHNTLIVLSTGLGKTNIFLMLAAHRLSSYPEGKILLIGPTKPLIEQYYAVFCKHLDIAEEKLTIMTGAIAPAKRIALWARAQVIFSTPQGLENDVISGKIRLDDVVLVGFDEAHRAVGEYSYVLLAKKYGEQAQFARIAAMTASPGSDTAKITEVCTNLRIEEIEVRTETDGDVQPYLQEIDVEYIKVDLPEEFSEVKNALERAIKNKLDQVKKLGFLRSAYGMKKTELLALQASLHGRLSQGERDFTIMKSISLLAEALKAGHALELLETQGITPLQNYVSRLQEEARTSKVKALHNLLADADFKAAMIQILRLHEEGIEHPKLERLRNIVAEELSRENAKIIVFNQYRDSAVKIKEVLDTLPGASSQIFVGQAKKATTGMTQKEQKEMMERFRAGKFNVLIATSIAEEGLDVPRVNTVVFYEPIPSAIRAIQRRGRTGRQEKGKVVILIARNTRDEAYRWVAHHKEQRMHRILGTLKETIKLQRHGLQRFIEKKPEKTGVKIFADHREKGKVVNELSSLGAAVELKTLPIGDYLCSSRVAVEIKKVEDFVASIIDGRLLKQLSELKRAYERPVLIIEGESDIYTVRNVHPNAIRGMLATIAVSYNIPVLHARNHAETAGLLFAIARREQEKSGEDIAVHATKPLTLQEQQEYIIASLPGVETTIAKSLLSEFGSVKKVVNASAEELQKAELIGQKKAAEISRIVNAEYGLTQEHA
jgi:ERCC4-related helicase